MSQEFSSKRDAHLFGPGPKRILSLDGGGVRGTATIAFLEQLEEQISELEGRPTRLGDWFDLIGGTSTGAIIATALSLGYRASEVRDFYMKLAPRIFKRSRFRLLGWQAKFDARLLMEELMSEMGDRTLDSPDVLTGLCIFLKRMDTGSAWTVMNNSRLPFWETPEDKSFIGNRHLPIVNLVRASTAAPSFFDPELIEIAPGQPRGLFIDGGLTPHNNPSLMLLMAAMVPAFGLNWKLGPNDLLIVSVGTGSFRYGVDSYQGARLSAIGLAMKSLSAMITESQQLVLTLMTYLGDSPVSWPINSEMGDLGVVLPPFGHLFRLLRYDLRLEDTWLRQELDATLSADVISRLQQMDQPSSMSTLYELGRKAAAKQIRRSHLEPFGPRAALATSEGTTLDSNL
jgi:predicted acylesterase/phospholipase RssA